MPQKILGSSENQEPVEAEPIGSQEAVVENANPVAVSVFNFENNTVRTVVDDSGAIWFVAKDVCDALAISNNRDALTRLDNDEKLVSVIPTSGQNREVLTINESGLYSLVMTSRKEEAKRFKKWVTSEVLPTIRKTGKYEAPKVEPKPESNLIENFKKASELIDLTIGMLAKLGIEGNQADFVTTIVTKIIIIANDLDRARHRERQNCTESCTGFLHKMRQKVRQLKLDAGLVA